MTRVPHPLNIYVLFFLSRDIASVGCRLPVVPEEGWVVMGVDVVALSTAINAKVTERLR